MSTHIFKVSILGALSLQKAPEPHACLVAWQRQGVDFDPRHSSSESSCDEEEPDHDENERSVEQVVGPWQGRVDLRERLFSGTAALECCVSERMRRVLCFCAGGR